MSKSKTKKINSKKYKVTISYTNPVYADVLVSAKDAREARAKIKKFINHKPTTVVLEEGTDAVVLNPSELAFFSTVEPFCEKVDKVEEYKKK